MTETVPDTGTSDLLARLDGGVLTLTLNRPENLNRAMAGEVEDCMDIEATHHVHCAQTEDHRHAVQAFVDKREPAFQGR